MEASTTPAPPSSSAERHLAAIEALLGKIIELGGLELKFEVRRNPEAPSPSEAPPWVVEFSGPDSNLLMASGGSLLNALEYLVLRAVRLEEELFGQISFDCQDFRRMRAEELRMTAEVAAARVVETGAPFALNPMTARDRRVVHLALKSNARVRTASDGLGHERRVVIHPVPEPRSDRGGPPRR
jgi:spoIIIJ-associated protein